MVKRLTAALLTCALGVGLSAEEPPAQATLQNAVVEEPATQEPEVDQKLIERTNASFQQASAVVAHYQYGTDWDDLRSGEPTIHRAWNSFLKYQGEEHPLVDELSLIRARSVTAAGRKSEIIPAWETALEKMPYTTAKGRRVNLYLEAAGAAADIKEYEKAEAYFAYARTFAVLGDEQADMTQLYMRMNELKTLGVSMQWRPLRDSILDLRKYAENFSLWTIPRIDALISEIELRMSLQPEGDEKRTDLSALKAKIVLAEKGIGDGMPPMQLTQIRSIYYALEDHYQL